MQDVGIDKVSAEQVVDRVRPAIRADGGDIEVVGVEGADLLIKLLGRCVGCPSAARTLRDGLEVRLRREVPNFGRIVQVH